MIYEALKWTVEQLIEQYECPECRCGISNNDINIIWAAGTSINMEVICPECKLSEFVEAQVFTLDLSKITQKQVKVDLLKDKIKNIQSYKKEITDVGSLLEEKINNKKIKDENIVWVNKLLKSKNFSLMDLFWEEKK